MRRGIGSARQAAYDKAHGNLEFGIVRPTKKFDIITNVIPTNVNIMKQNGQIVPQTEDSWKYDSKYDRHYYCADEVLDIVHGLSTVAYDIFKIIRTKIKFNSNWVELDNKELLELTSAKYMPQIYKAIKELIEKDIIEKGNVRDVYIINHNLFVYGSYNSIIDKLKGCCVFTDAKDGICEDPTIIIR